MFSFVSPVVAPYDQVQSGWGDDRSYRGAGKVHEGIDFRCPVGTPVLAIASGTVDDAFLASDGNAGYMMQIVHDGDNEGVMSRYLHLSSFAVPKGSKVTKGQVVGLSGQSGSAQGDPQLHFDLRLSQDAAASYLARFGIPGPAGLPQHTDTFASPDYAAPAEAVIPAVYTADVKARAAALGVKLYSGSGWAWLVAAGAGLAWWFWPKKRSRNGR